MALRSSVCLIAASLGASVMSGAAFSQDEEAPASAERIVVTGSRIARSTDFNAATPTTVVDDTYLENLGLVNVGDAVTQLPSNLSSFQPTTTGNSNFFAGSAIANLRGLNPFFGSRTLTMVDSRRHVPTNQGDGVDLNFIPTVLIDRVETVTGGASAAYGSGAISGVQNIMLDRDLEGFRGQVDYGVSGEGDGEDYHAGAAYGVAFQDGRGAIVIGAEWQDSSAVGCVEARDWCAEGNGLMTNANAFGLIVDPTRANNIISSNLRANQRSYTGVFVNSFVDATNVLQANAAGTGTTTFNVGDEPAISAGQAFAFFGGSNVVGGDGISANEYTNLRAPVERTIVNGLFDYDLNDQVTFFVEGSVGSVETDNRSGALNHDDGLFTAPSINCADNYWVNGVNAGLNAACLASGGRIRKDWTSQVNSHTLTTTDVWRVATGFNGTYLGDWVWDAYFQYGESDRMQYVADNRHLNRYLFAIDTVAGPGGQPMCRWTRDGVAPAAAGFIDPALAAQIGAGCVPLNPFGSGAIDPAAYDYAFGFLREDLNYSQRVVAANTSGDLFRGFGAGPISLGLGAEYRVEQGENLGAEELPDAERQDFLIQYGESFAGDVQVLEAYAELNAPLIADMPFAELVELNAAIRQSQYTNKGKEGTTGETRVHDITSHKVTAIWDPIEWLRLRGSQSRDIRAANFRELYYGQFINAGGAFGFVNNPFTTEGGCGAPFAQGGFPCDPANYDLRGNVDVKPEKADTMTLGFVVTPRDSFGGWLNGFEFAADYFDIEIEDSIQQASIQRTLDGCYVGMQEFCDLITFGATRADIITVAAESFNAPQYHTRGVDYSVSYTTDIGDDELALRLIASNLLEQRLQQLASVPGAPVAPPIDPVGQLGSTGFLADYQSGADWRANLTATYTHGPLSLTGQAQYVSSGVLDWNALPNEYTSNEVDAHTTYNLNGAYTLGDFEATSVQLFLSINNVLDEDPPLVANTPAGANALFHDVLGRTFRVGARATF